MTSRFDITREQANTLITYDPTKGVFTWKERNASMFEDGDVLSAERKCMSWNAKHAGKSAGATNHEGYIYIRLYGKHVRGHRLAWLMMMGDWPETYLDHVDGNPSNNSWKNLRLADPTQNRWNVRMHKNNKSGMKGVSWNARKQKWVSTIAYNKKRFHLGYFLKKEDASQAYKTAAQKLFGEFARFA